MEVKQNKKNPNPPQKDLLYVLSAGDVQPLHGKWGLSMLSSSFRKQIP